VLAAELLGDRPAASARLRAALGRDRGIAFFIDQLEELVT
jgi:hypothetical protein